MDTEYVQGNRAAKIKLFGLLAILVTFFLYLKVCYETPELPSVRNKQELDALLYQQFLDWLIYAGMCWAFSAWLFRLGLKTKRSGRWPPPDFSMPFKTKIQKGRLAENSWKSLFAGAAVSAITPFFSLYALFRLSQIAEMLN